MKTRRFLSGLLVFFITALLLAACARKEALTEERAIEIGLNAIKALSDGDYDAYTRDFTVMMKAVVPEEDFIAYHDAAAQNLGKFIEFEKVESAPAETEGFVLWKYTSVFEKGKLLLTLTFKENNDKVEGVFFDEVS